MPNKKQRTQNDKHGMYYKWMLAVKQKIIILECTDTEKLAKEERCGDGGHIDLGTRGNRTNFFVNFGFSY